MRRDEGFADAPAFRAAYRDVLQVGIVRGEPSGDCHGLRIAGMHAARRAIDRQRQLVGVGGFEFRHAAIFQQDLRQRVIEREFLQHFLVGGRRAARGLLHHRQAEFVEQDLLYLLRRIQVERLPGGLVRPGFQRDQFFAQLAALDLQQRAVEQHAVALHRVQHMHARHLDVAIHMLQAASVRRSAGTDSDAIAV